MLLFCYIIYKVIKLAFFDEDNTDDNYGTYDNYNYNRGTRRQSLIDQDIIDLITIDQI